MADSDTAAEFISSLAIRNNAQLILTTISTSTPPSLINSLVTAAHQTGGRVVFLDGDTDIHSTILADEYYLQVVDFVVVDCGSSESNYSSLLQCLETRGNKQATLIGYDAFRQGIDLLSGGGGTSRRSSTHLLPVEKGLLVTRIGRDGQHDQQQQHQERRRRVVKTTWSSCQNARKWIVKVDKCTGEEHFFRFRSSPRKEGAAAAAGAAVFAA